MLKNGICHTTPPETNKQTELPKNKQTKNKKQTKTKQKTPN